MGVVLLEVCVRGSCTRGPCVRAPHRAEPQKPRLGSAGGSAATQARPGLQPQGI